MAKKNEMKLVSYKIEAPPFHFSLCHDLDLHNISFELLKKKKNILLNLSNAGFPVVDKINSLGIDFVGIRVIRDPRQILVSNYFHHLKDHAYESQSGWFWDKLYHDQLAMNSLSQEDGLLYELDNITKDVLENQIFGWRDKNRVLEIKLEDFESSSLHYVNKIAEFSGMEIPDDMNLSNKRANIDSKKWSNCFTPEIKARFKDRYGEQLIELGYESDLNW
ncbi:MAG: hypothetical protein V7708_17680 [Oceanicoccus sp.]